jgi:hypothetical protein
VSIAYYIFFCHGNLYFNNWILIFLEKMTMDFRVWGLIQGRSLDVVAHAYGPNYKGNKAMRTDRLRQKQEFLYKK